MSEKTPASAGGMNRRAVLRSIAMALTAAGSRGLSLEAGRFVHAVVEQEKSAGSAYQPRFFKEHEFRTVTRLVELILPADEVSGSAAEAGAPEFIDLLCSQNRQLAGIYTGGLSWLDRATERASGKSFAEAADEEQHEMLKALAREARVQELREQEIRNAKFKTDSSSLGFLQYTGEPESTLGPGGRFFVWVRRMAVDAFYTSPMGIQDIGYQGNGYWERYRVPKEAVEHVLGPDATAVSRDP